MTKTLKLHPSIEPETPPGEPVYWCVVGWRQDGQNVTIHPELSAWTISVLAKTAWEARELLVRTENWAGIAPQDLIVAQTSVFEYETPQRDRAKARKA